jgi:DNA-binding helix-hairpin-helix protein with protein kinase domain
MSEFSPVPVPLGVFVQRCKHDGQYDLDIVTDQVAKVFVVPEVQRSFGDLVSCY